MSKAKLTMIGLENYMQANNDSLFSSMILPEELERDDVVDNILMRAGEFEVLYADPYFLKDAISLWSRKNRRTFDKWYTALQIEYNPLDNYDRIEEWQESGTNDNTGKIENSGSISESGNVNTVNTANNSNENINSRSAYDSNTFVNDTKATNTSTGTNNLSENTSNTKTDNTKQDTSNHEVTSTTRFGRLHGNIGVTSSQMLLESELSIAKWNLCDQIADLFISEFCITVY